MKMRNGWIVAMSILGIILSAFGLGGCIDDKNAGPEMQELYTAEIRSVLYGCNHMDRLYSFRFSLRQTDENECILDAQYGTEDAEELTVLENVLLQEDAMTELRTLFESNGIIESLCAAQNASERETVPDQTTYTLTVVFRDGTGLSSSDVQANEELENFFRALADQESPAF